MADLCVGCDHPHEGGRDKPCPCGCFGFVRSMAVYARQGCENPDCPTCREEGRHPPREAAV